MSHQINSLNMQGNKIINLADGGTNVSDAVNYGQISALIAGGITGINISAGSTSNNLTAFTFSNGSGVSFGLNASVITATVKTDYQSSNANYLTSQSNQAASASNGSFAWQTLNFSNANNVTFGTSAGSIITASVAAPSGITNIKVSAGTASNNLSALTFSDSNGVSFGLNGSVITGSVATSLTNIKVSAGTASNNLSALTFSDSNGVSFGLNGSVVTGSIATSLTNIKVSAGTASNNLSAVTFSDSNGVSFGLNGSVVTATVATNYLASQSAQVAAAGGDIWNFQTISFEDVNSVSFYSTNAGVGVKSIKLNLYAVSNTTQSTSGTAQHTALSFGGAGGASVGVTGGTVVISAPVGGGLSAVNISAGTTSNNLTALTFTDSNGVSFGLNGSVVTATVKTDYQSSNANYLTSQSNQAASASNGSFTFQTVAFSNANNVTFGTSAGSIITASVNTGLTSQSNQAASASNGSFAFQTLAFSNANNVTFGTSAGSIITASISPGGAGDGVNIIAAGTQTANTTGTVSFANSNGISFGMSNSSVVTASFAGMSAGVSTGGNTSGSTGTVSNRLVFVGTRGIGLSQSSNAGSATITIDRPVIASHMSFPVDNRSISNGAFSGANQVLFVYPFHVPYRCSATIVEWPISISSGISSAATNTTYGGTYSHGWGIYSYDTANSRLQSASTASSTFTFSYASNTGNYSSVTGPRLLTMALNADMTEGQYWMAYSISSQGRRTNSTGGTVNTTIRIDNYIPFQGGPAGFFGRLNAATNATIKFFPFDGRFGASAAFPSTMGDSAISYETAVAHKLVFDMRCV